MIGESAGGRVRLDLVQEGGETVTYSLTLGAGRDWSGRAVVRLADGDVSFEGLSGDPPAWLVDAARAFLRAAWSSRRTQPRAPWPRRILRWRDAP